MSTYILIKLIHITAVMLSGALFFVRGLGSIYDAPFMQLKIIKIAPHVIDSVLLLAAIGLCIQIQQYPFVDDWVTVKVLVLVVYIVVGSIAIKRGKTRTQKIIAFVAAILAFLFMVSVARTHDAWGLFSLL